MMKKITTFILFGTLVFFAACSSEGQQANQEAPNQPDQNEPEGTNEVSSSNEPASGNDDRVDGIEAEVAEDDLGEADAGGSNGEMVGQENQPENISGNEVLPQDPPFVVEAPPENICQNGILDAGEICDEQSVFCVACEPVVYLAHDTSIQEGVRLHRYHALSPNGQHLILSLGYASGPRLYHIRLQGEFMSQMIEAPGPGRNFGSRTPLLFSQDGHDLYFWVEGQGEENDGVYRYSLGSPDIAPVRLAHAAEFPGKMSNVLYDDGTHFYYQVDNGNKSETWHWHLDTNVRTKLPDHYSLPVFHQNVAYLVPVNYNYNADSDDLVKITIDNGLISRTNLTENFNWNGSSLWPMNFKLAPNQEFLIFSTISNTSNLPEGLPNIEFYKILLQPLVITPLINYVDRPGLQNFYCDIHPNSRYFIYSVLDDPQNLGGPATVWMKDLLQTNNPDINLSLDPNNANNLFKMHPDYSMSPYSDLAFQYDLNGNIYYIGVKFLGGEHMDKVHLIEVPMATRIPRVYAEHVSETKQILHFNVSNQALPSVVSTMSTKGPEGAPVWQVHVKKNFPQLP